MSLVYKCDLCGKTNRDKEYEEFFKKALKKFNVDNPSNLNDKKKKEIFDYIHKKWKPDNAETYTKKEDATFINTPLMLQIPNYENKNYNFYLSLNLTLAADTEKIEEYERNKQTQSSFFTFSEDSGFSISTSKNLKLDNPNPNICVNCKKEIIKLMLSYGRFDEMVNIKNI